MVLIRRVILFGDRTVRPVITSDVKRTVQRRNTLTLLGVRNAAAKKIQIIHTRNGRRL